MNKPLKRGFMMNEEKIFEVTVMFAIPADNPGMATETFKKEFGELKRFAEEAVEVYPGEYVPALGDYGKSIVSVRENTIGTEILGGIEI